MAGKLNSSDSSISEINVTPFVDVVLVLLVIFMITAPALVRDTISVQLPRSTTSEKNSNLSDALPIVITAAGNLLFQGEPVSDEALLSRLKNENKPGRTAVIASDEKAQHGHLVRVIDIVKKAGIQKFAIQVKR